MHELSFPVVESFMELSTGGSTWFIRVLPYLVLKAKHFSSSAFCHFHRLGVPELALAEWGFGTVVEAELSCGPVMMV